MAKRNINLRVIFSNLPLAGLMAILGGGVYLVQSLLYAFTQFSEVDEGAYLYQGYLFAKGIYHPFQANGPWMYNAPLSYLIWGYLQAWFGPGLRSGRYIAVVLGLLMLVAVWIAARRLGGKWGGAIVVWAIALDPALIKLYSMAESQVLIACMLAWVLVLVLGEERPLWQIVTGSFLTGVMIMTRHNLVLVLPILLIYIFWQHGKKAGVWSLSAGLLTLVIGYAVYWPNILVIWAPWLPANWMPFLAAFRPPQEGSVVLGNSDLKERILALTAGFRFQFAALMGSLAALILWPRHWKNHTAYRSAVFLAVLFFALLALHAWGSIFNNFCIFCFTPYLAYFSFVALLLVVALLAEGEKQASLLRQVIAAVFVLLLFIDIGYSSYGISGIWVMNLRIPRFKTLLLTGKLVRGIAIWDFLGTRFHLSSVAARQVAPTVAGAVIALAVLLITYGIWRVTLRKAGYAWMSFTLAVVLAAGTILSPAQVLAGAPRDYDCPVDNIRAYEQAGRYLAGLVRPGSKVYWDGGSAITPLLYVPGIEILPGQIYDFWSFSPEQDTARVLKFGMWNETSAEQWRNQADYILIAVSRYTVEWDQFFQSTQLFEEMGRSPAPNTCQPGSAIRVFKRKT